MGLKAIDLINHKYCGLHLRLAIILLHISCSFELFVFFSVRLAEGEQILTGGVLNKQKSQDDIITEFGDSACFTLALLGQIYWYVKIVWLLTLTY